MGADRQRLPIHMSAPMIWGLKHRRKTQTRRTSGLEEVPPGMRFKGMVIDGRNYCARFDLGEGGFPRVTVRCPYGRPGWRLWVREALKKTAHAGVNGGPAAEYAADGLPTSLRLWTWKNDGIPPMFMPASVSRFELEVVDVTVQRLHEITEADAIAEGLEPRGRGWAWPGEQRAWHFAREAYQAGWEWLNGEASWALDPWIWRVSFNLVAG